MYFFKRNHSDENLFIFNDIDWFVLFTVLEECCICGEGFVLVFQFGDELCVRIVFTFLKKIDVFLVSFMLPPRMITKFNFGSSDFLHEETIWRPELKRLYSISFSPHFL